MKKIMLGIILALSVVAAGGIYAAIEAEPNVKLDPVGDILTEKEFQDIKSEDLDIESLKELSENP